LVAALIAYGFFIFISVAGFGKYLQKSKKQKEQRVNKNFTNLNHPKQSKAHALENIPEFL
jgi:hypothetical protein